MDNKDKTHLSETQFQKLFNDAFSNLDSKKEEVDREQKEKSARIERNIKTVLINVAMDGIENIIDFIERNFIN